MEARQEPKVVVLDLDATVWTPELYTLRAPRSADVKAWRPRFGEDVRLIDGVLDVLRGLADSKMQVAIASRTSRASWARSLLREIVVKDGVTLEDLCGLRVQIYPGDKSEHFRKIRETTGVGFEDMVFFDDALEGRYGNCRPIAALGVLAVHTPRGLTSERWSTAIEAFANGDRGTVIRAPGEDDDAPFLAGDAMRCVSMALPFAALLLNGAKTLETRNSRMFSNLEGQDVVIRVGHRDWDDSEWRALYENDDDPHLMPPGFKRGALAGVVTVGKTLPIADVAAQEGWPAAERAALAPKHALP
ncbi:hypothetical protein CTAYLR_008338 [Chrysophaeum taylorii]|uniref:Uncharacterized protein n=1 Tax=Chrysophaeum taylorii TaxID=2483200 RepID=A0AAD7UE50_9STRA|nr:hypothetical protein CTAYLR_008338 [Chrysophaeum taylorii]